MTRPSATTRRADLVSLLRELVAIDSVNPSLVPGGAGETAIADHLEQWAKANELRAERLEATPGRPSVLIRTASTGGGRSLMLCGHTDTVGNGRMTDPLVPTVDGDRLYGRGAYDMKAGLAAALVAAREASRLGLAGEVVVAAVADEEHSSLGVQEVLRHVRTDAAIVTEPTELTVATAHRGFVWTEIEVVGIAAHGSRPHLGKDAILKTGPILVALSDLNERLRGRTHPRLGRGFVHGGLLSGGREASTIPDLCTLTIERRTLPGETVEDVERDVADLLAACRTADPDLEAGSRTTLARPPFEIDDAAPFVQTVAVDRRRGAGAPGRARRGVVLGGRLPDRRRRHPHRLFGPPGDGAHAAVEWVSLDGTVDCARALLATAQRFCA
jgi:acetylornithine deacetylase